MCARRRSSWCGCTRSNRPDACIGSSRRARRRSSAPRSSFTGGRWQVSFTVRYQQAARPVKQPRTRTGGTVGVDVGLTHLATLSRPIPGVSDEHGHVPNPRPLAAKLAKLQELDRRIARCQRLSNNRAKLVARRARLHGTIAAIRKTAHHRLVNELAARFDTVVIEDLNIQGHDPQPAIGPSARRRRVGSVPSDSHHRMRRPGHTSRHGRPVVSVVEDMFGMWGSESQTAPHDPSLRLRHLRHVPRPGCQRRVEPRTRPSACERTLHHHRWCGRRATTGDRKR